MKQIWIRLLSAVLCLSFLLAGIPGASAEETAITYPVRQPAPEVENDPEDPDAAQNISNMSLVKNSSGMGDVRRMFDRNKNYGMITPDSASMTLEYESGMGYLYFIFGEEYGEFTVTDHDTGKQVTCGTNRFLHELIDLEALFGEPIKSLTVDFANGSVAIKEVYVYTPGYLPDHIQAWEAPEEGAVDLILFSTHGDDDQLFFAGLLPYYAAEVGCGMQVVYLTDHRSGIPNLARPHEMLNGLWAVGVKAYPVFGDFADFRIDDLQGTYDYYEDLGTSKEELQGFVVEQIRRFKPQVAGGPEAPRSSRPCGW